MLNIIVLVVKCALAEYRVLEAAARGEELALQPPTEAQLEALLGKLQDSTCVLIGGNLLPLCAAADSHKPRAFLREFFAGSDVAVRARLEDLKVVVGANFFTEVADCGVDSPAELTKKLVADVFASGDAARLRALAGLFADYVQEFDLALLLCGRALALQVAAVGPDHAYVGATYNRMANVLRSQGEYGRALELYEKALAIQARALGPDHDDVASTYHDMAMVLNTQGELGQALGLYEKCLAIKAAALGPEHTDVASTYNNMASVLKAQGELGEALGLQEKALTIFIKALGPDHALVADTYSNMATVLYQQGELGKALGLYEKALSIQVRALGPDHIDVGKISLNMGSLAATSGDPARAWKLYTDAHRVFTLVLGPAHQFTQHAAQGLAWCREYR